MATVSASGVPGYSSEAIYGFWAPAVHDYEVMGIMNWTDTPEYAALMKIEEPYEYRDRLTMPKLMINAAGDQFFLPDSSQFYWKLDQFLRARSEPAPLSVRWSESECFAGQFLRVRFEGTCATCA